MDILPKSMELWQQLLKLLQKIHSKLSLLISNLLSLNNLIVIHNKLQQRKLIVTVLLNLLPQLQALPAQLSPPPQLQVLQVLLSHPPQLQDLQVQLCRLPQLQALLVQQAHKQLVLLLVNNQNYFCQKLLIFNLNLN